MTSSADLTDSASALARARVEGHEVRWLSDRWEATATAPDLCSDPADLDAVDWWPARVPGTAAGVLRDADVWRPGDSHDFDLEDWWFRTSFAAAPPADGEEVVLCLDGIATVFEAHLNGELILTGDSMFAAHQLDVGALLRGANELAIRCRALAPLLHTRRRPRARWRTRLVSDGNIRFFRTMLLGRAPGFAPGPAAVGPWRGVRLERRRRIARDQLSLRARVSGRDGRLEVRARLRTLDGAPPVSAEVTLSRGSECWRAPLTLETHEKTVAASGELTVPDVALWWPHTHGEPALYEAQLIVTRPSDTVTVDAGRVGFRSLSFGKTANHELEVDGVDLHVNGVPVFARGCVWTPVDPIGLAPACASLRAALEQARDAGMNLLRIPGTSAYEEEAFHDLCDELGVLVWQDFMFANLDYPFSEETFAAAVRREAKQVLDGLASRPSLAVLCGNSEIEQQVAMLGLDPSLARGELFGELLPSLVRESGTDAAYLRSAPCGGEFAFRADRGVANYYGVGGYGRGLDDARRAEVRFAAECLAFSNVPDEAAIEELLPDAPGNLVVTHPRWKAGVPRDSGSGWDFEDVRDHYLKLLFGVDPAELRRVNHERYLELSRMLTGEVMAEVLGEWRRAASPCTGGLVLWLRDFMPGAGWGVVDHRGEPKAAYHHLRRALAPIAVWTTDEGLNGVLAHVANDGATPLRGRLRIALYRDFEHCVQTAEEAIELPPHSVSQWSVESILGRFVDVAWAYRFGPPQQDLIVASLERDPPDEGPALVSQAMRMPAGRPTTTAPAARLGLQAHLVRQADGALSLRVSSRRLAYGVRVQAPGFAAADDAFSVEPGGERLIRLQPRTVDATFTGGALTAVNLQGRLPIELEQAQLGELEQAQPGELGQAQPSATRATEERVR
jgi:beta-mannosidase